MMTIIIIILMVIIIIIIIVNIIFFITIMIMVMCIIMIISISNTFFFTIIELMIRSSDLVFTRTINNNETKTITRQYSITDLFRLSCSCLRRHCPDASRWRKTEVLSLISWLNAPSHPRQKTKLDFLGWN